MVRYAVGSTKYLQNISGVLDVRDEPVVLFGGPLGPRLDLHVLHGWNELIDDQMLQTDLSSQLSDAIHEILPFSVNDLSDIIELILGHAVARLDSLSLLVDLFEFFLLGGEVLLELHLHVLLGSQVLFHGKLCPTALLQFSLRLEQFLLLLHGFLHLFIAAQKLFFHILDLL